MLTDMIPTSIIKDGPRRPASIPEMIFLRGIYIELVRLSLQFREGRDLMDKLWKEYHHLQSETNAIAKDATRYASILNDLSGTNFTVYNVQCQYQLTFDFTKTDTIGE